MVVTIIGMKSIDFTNKEGERIKGTNLIYTYEPFDDASVVGRLADKVFISDTSKVVFPKIDVGSDYEFIYEFTGRRAILTRIVPAD